MIVLKDVTLFGSDQSSLITPTTVSISAGEKAVLTGPSGCGKSSILRAIPGGFEQWSGEITVGGIQLSPKNIAPIREKIAFIPQEPRLPDGTVAHFFDTVSHWRGNRSKYPSRKIQLDLLEEIELGFGIMEKETSILSGGERQRIAIAAAILLNRPVLLADEITSALDELSRNAVMNLIFNLPVTLLSVSHDPVWIERCDRTITMKGGNRG